MGALNFCLSSFCYHELVIWYATCLMKCSWELKWKSISF